jgi:hypothetical protein
MTTISFVSHVSNFVRSVKGGGTSLKNSLACITDSGFVDFPMQCREQLFTVVTRESQEKHGRKVIMNHVSMCFADVAKQKAWKRIKAAMILVEELLANGSPALFAEISMGLHFDLVQKLSLLEHFQHTSNERAKFIVRSKAQALRSNLVKRLQSCDESKELDIETESTCSPRGSLAESVSSCCSALSATSSLPQVKPMFDFEDLMEWADAECYDSDDEGLTH